MVTMGLRRTGQVQPGLEVVAQGTPQTGTWQLEIATFGLPHLLLTRKLVDGNDAALEDLLRRAWEVARAPSPSVDLPADIFVRYLAERLPEDCVDVPLERVLERLMLSDLYLACAYVHKVSGADKLLERHWLEKLPTFLTSLKLSPMLVDEVCQSLRIHLLLSTVEGGPRLAGYTGRGTLMSWMWVIAARMARKQRTPNWETPTENAFAELEAVPMLGADAEFELIKRRYRPEFRQALREAFAALSSEQRLLLRLHFIRRMSTTKMGPIFGVDQSTVSRRSRTARYAVHDETKRRLKERLGLSTDEFESLIKAIESQFDSSLSEDLEDEEKNKGEEAQSQGEEEKEGDEEG